MSLRLWLLLCGLLLPAGALQAGGYDFSIPEADQKPFELGGRLELRYLYHRFDQDALPYKLNAAQADPGADSHEWRPSLELSGGYRQGIAQVRLLTHHEYVHTGEGDDWIGALYEGYVSLTPSANLTLDAGKKSVLWGKGYAWNPAAFINRPKDPDDAGLSLEGRTLLGVDLIKSFSAGHLTNMGLTALLLPVIDDWANAELGEDGDLYTALKLYLLWRDTDIDFIFFDGPEQPRGLGFDFAKNLAENIAIHGELALRQDAPRMVLHDDGRISQTREDQLSYLLGVRYLNTHDTTFIVEYYHNGAGYDRETLEDFFVFQRTALDQWQSGGDAAVLQRAAQITRPFYQQRNFGEDYLYFKASQKEPFNLLYFNPWAAVMVNLQDLSYNVQAGAAWTAVTNLEVSFRLGIPIGPARTEFGEKPDVFRPELWVRYFF